MATAVFISASFCAFATLGERGGGGGNQDRAGLLYPMRSVSLNSRDFSLRSGYNYRTNNLLLSTAPRKEKFIILNTVTTFQKGNTTYIMPLKKKVILDKVKFTPSPARF